MKSEFISDALLVEVYGGGDYGDSDSLEKCLRRVAEFAITEDREHVVSYIKNNAIWVKHRSDIIKFLEDTK